MEAGVYGLAIESGNFVDIGSGLTLRYESIDDRRNVVKSIFLHTPDRTITAESGKFQMTRDGNLSVRLENRLCICPGKRAGDGNLPTTMPVSFASFEAGASIDRQGLGSGEQGASRYKTWTLPELARSGDRAAIAAVAARCLWLLFVSLMPMIAFVLGQPPRRTSHAYGLILGFPLLVLAIRSAGFVDGNTMRHPVLAALAIGGIWCLAIYLLLIAHRRFGPGFVDTWIDARLKSLSLGRRRRSRAPALRASTLEPWPGHDDYYAKPVPG